MKKTIGLLLLCGSVACASEYPKVDQDIKTYDDHIAELNNAFGQTHANPKDKEWVKSKLQHMFDVDQYMRKYYDIQFSHSYTDQEKAEFQKQFGPRNTAIDSGDTSDLKDLLKFYRWFTISDFGAKADNQAWIIVQHADLDPDFQSHVLSILTDLYTKGETSPTNYAYLYDRVAASYINPSKRKLQRYGTQGACTGPGTWAPIPMEDPDHLDERRHQVGLHPEAEYLKMFRDICH